MSLEDYANSEMAYFDKKGREDKLKDLLKHNINTLETAIDLLKTLSEEDIAWGSGEDEVLSMLRRTMALNQEQLNYLNRN